MAALPTPLSLFSLNARNGAETQFIQEGVGFVDSGGNPTVTQVLVNDTNSVAADRYTFVVSSYKVLSNERMLVTVTCTPPAKKSAQTNIQILVTKGSVTEDSGPIPTILKTRRQITLDHNRLEKPLMRLFQNSKQVLHLPVTGLGDVITGTVDSDGKGTWKVRKAVQKKNWVNVVLQCTNPAVTYVAPVTGCLTVTLTAEDLGSIDVPMDATYTSDPDEDP